MLVLSFISVITALIIGYQDIQKREISLYALGGIFTVQLIAMMLQHPYSEVFINLAINIGFIIFQLFFLTVYFSIKNRKITNVINTYLGIGDVVFLSVLALSFGAVNFGLFFLLTCIIALMCVVGLRLFSVQSQKEIPFAAYISLVFIISVLIENIHPGTLYNNYLFL